jgi:hypothetical protein
MRSSRLQRIAETAGRRTAFNDGYPWFTPWILSIYS